MANRLTEDLAALFAMKGAKMSTESIAKVLHRSADWCERMVELDEERQRREAAEGAERERLAEERRAAFLANAARGREVLAARRKAEADAAAAEPGEAGASIGEGRVVRSFHVCPAGYGAAVELGDRLLFVETGSTRLLPEARITPVAGAGVFTWSAQADAA